MNRKEIVCYNTDASRAIGLADKVVFPKSVNDVQRVMKVAEKDIVPRGAGSGLMGGCVPQNSIVVDMSKMNKVANFNPAKKTVCVEAGITIKELNEKLRGGGFEFPIEPSNQGISTIGGMIATNALGNRSMKYGAMKDWINEIEFVNGRGELMKTSRTDLTEICGMEGITGIIVKATLKIIPLMRRSASFFQTDEIDEALSIARRLRLEKEVVMLELFSPEVSKLLSFPRKYHILVEFDSNRGRIEGKDYETISKLKDKAYYVLASKGYYSSEDPKLFFDKLKEFIILLENNEIPYFGCLGNGIVHPFFKDGEDKRELVVNFIKKTKSKPGKYGIGLKRKDFLDDFEKKIIQRVKFRHDPFGKLNKGKVVDIDFVKGRGVERFKDRKQEEAVKLPKEETASGFLEELKTPEEKMEEFIEKASEVEERGEKKEEVVDEIEVSEEVEERLKDYGSTFQSELAEEKRKRVEEFAKNVSKEIVKKTSPANYDEIKDIMTNKYGFDVKKGQFEGSEEVLGGRGDGGGGGEGVGGDGVEGEGGNGGGRGDGGEDGGGDRGDGGGGEKGKKSDGVDYDAIKDIMTNKYKDKKNGN